MLKKFVANTGSQPVNTRFVPEKWVIDLASEAAKIFAAEPEAHDRWCMKSGAQLSLEWICAEQLSRPVVDKCSSIEKYVNQ